MSDASSSKRIFVGIDLEGVSGVLAPFETVQGTAAWQAATELMAGDLAAVLQACWSCAVDAVVVSDGHADGRNIVAADLFGPATLVGGEPRRYGPMEGLDGSFAGALFVGYHARAGTLGGIMDHTYSSRTIFQVRWGGGEPVGEFGLHAAFAGIHGVPVALVTGDSAVVEEATAVCPWVESAIVKTGRMRSSGDALSLELSRMTIGQATLRALETVASAPCYEPPADELEVTFLSTAIVDALDGLLATGHIERVDARTVRVNGGDYAGTFRLFLACVDAAESVVHGDAYVNVDPLPAVRRHQNHSA